MTDAPLEIVSFFSILIIVKAFSLSSPLVGSSRKIRLGSVISSTARAVLFLSLAEIPVKLNKPPTMLF